MLKTENEGYGFHGTIAAKADAERAWGAAMDQLMTTTGCSELAAQAFLDSRFGRHFADETAGFLMGGDSVERAVARAAERWMGWRISRACSRSYGIPVGLPYLTGFVEHALMEKEF